MGTLRDAQYYDELYANSDKYRLAAEDSPHYPIWRAAAEYVRKYDVVTDMGCGPGHMAVVLREKTKDYVGLDFSRYAIEQAREVAPWGNFFKWDAQKVPWPLLSDVYLFIEVLEHVEDDIALLSFVPSGVRIVLSVPNFDSEAHVRTFATKEDVVARYSSVMEFEAHTTLSFSAHPRVWHIASGRRL